MTFSTQGVYLRYNKLEHTVCFFSRQFLVRLFFLYFIHKIKKEKIELLNILSYGISITEACIITQDNIIV